MAQLLFLTPTLPWPAEQGGRQRSHALLAALSKEGPVHVVATHPPEDAGEDSSAAARASEALAALGVTSESIAFEPRFGQLGMRGKAAKLGALASGRSDLVARWAHPELSRRVAAALRGARLVVVDHVWPSAWLPAGFLARAAQGEGPPVVFSTHNVEHRLLSDLRAQSRLGRIVAGLQERALERRERALVSAARLVLAVSVADYTALGAHLKAKPSPAGAFPGAEPPSGQRLLLAPNGIALSERPQLPPAQAPVCDMLYLGGADYRPNAEAAEILVREVLPLVAQRQPEARVTLVGRDPGAHYAALAAEAPAVRALGHVSDLLGSWAAAGSLVAPIASGGGSRIKLLEAFALGRPVVTTPKGAEGLDVTDGHELLLGRSPAECAQAVLRLQEDPALAAGLIERARVFVERQHDWSAIMETAVEAIRQLGPDPRAEAPVT